MSALKLNLLLVTKINRIISEKEKREVKFILPSYWGGIDEPYEVWFTEYTVTVTTHKAPYIIIIERELNFTTNEVEETVFKALVIPEHGEVTWERIMELLLSYVEEYKYDAYRDKWFTYPDAFHGSLAELLVTKYHSGTELVDGLDQVDLIIRDNWLYIFPTDCLATYTKYRLGTREEFRDYLERRIGSLKQLLRDLRKYKYGREKEIERYMRELLS